MRVLVSVWVMDLSLTFGAKMYQAFFFWAINHFQNHDTETYLLVLNAYASLGMFLSITFNLNYPVSFYLPFASGFITFLTPLCPIFTVSLHLLVGVCLTSCLGCVP